ncbi:phosphatase 2C-like domain-containing protein [Schizophyllum commune]
MFLTSLSRCRVASIKRIARYSTVASEHPYVFHIGAAWNAKPSDPSHKRPPPQTVPFAPDSPIGKWRDETLKWPRFVRTTRDAGEDFFCVQAMKCDSVVALGVADGVGGWADSGVDPALFAQAMMYHTARYSRAAWAGEPEIDPTLDYEEREEVEGWELTPYECMDLAYGGVLRERGVLGGASTACLITLNAASGLLRSANLGDSGYAVVRSKNVIYHQEPQTHYFNCPLQLTKVPVGDRHFSGVCVDSPRHAATHSMKLRDGDLVVLYTDGFGDNIFLREMTSILSLSQKHDLPDELMPQFMADRLVDRAHQTMYSGRVTPFQKEAARYGQNLPGGKIDDVTVVVALVRETS